MEIKKVLGIKVILKLFLMIIVNMTYSLTYFKSTGTGTEGTVALALMLLILALVFGVGHSIQSVKQETMLQVM